MTDNRSTAPPMGALWSRVTALTGTDPTRPRAGATGVLVTGTAGVGVRSLIDACAGLAADLDMSARGAQGWSRRIGLYVVDPSSSVGAEERAALLELRSTCGIVAIVCTKIDAFWEWPRIVRAHRRVLDPSEMLPVFAVSSPAAAAGAVADSGIDELLDWLRDTLAATADPVRMRIGVALAALDGLSAEPEPGAAAPVELSERRRRILIADRDRGRTERLAAVRAGLARVRAHALTELQEGVRTLSAEVATVPASRTADRLGARMEMLAKRVWDGATDRIERVRATTLLGLDPEDRAQGRADPVPAVGPHRTPPTGRRTAEDALLMLLGASTGLGVGRLIVAPMAAVDTLQWISMPLTLILGVGVAIWVIGLRRDQAAGSRHRRWADETLAEFRGRLDQQLGMRVAATESELTGAITRHHERRTKRVMAEVAALDEQARTARAAAPAAPAAAARRTEIDAVRRALAAALAELPPVAPAAGQDPDHRDDIGGGVLDGTAVR